MLLYHQMSLCVCASACISFGLFKNTRKSIFVVCVCVFFLRFLPFSTVIYFQHWIFRYFLFHFVCVCVIVSICRCQFETCATHIVVYISNNASSNRVNCHQKFSISPSNRHDRPVQNYLIDWNLQTHCLSPYLFFIQFFIGICRFRRAHLGNVNFLANAPYCVIFTKLYFI